ncbi:MAG: mechanosensitive ion channel protein MscS, partial [Shimia sp.]
MRTLLKGFMSILVASMLVTASFAKEETASEEENPKLDNDVYLHAVVVDGEEIFSVRGSTALPAEERAELVADRIVQVAESSEATNVHVRVERSELGRTIYIDGNLVTVTTKADADFEQMDIVVLAQLHAEAVEAAILDYRSNRTAEAFSHGTTTALIWS